MMVKPLDLRIYVTWSTCSLLLILLEGFIEVLIFSALMYWGVLDFSLAFVQQLQCRDEVSHHPWSLY
jgi:hypothetical protein